MPVRGEEVRVDREAHAFDEHDSHEANGITTAPVPFAVHLASEGDRFHYT